MRHDEQVACTEWLRHIMAEHSGPSNPTTMTYLDMKNFQYSANNYRYTLSVYLPSELCEHIESVYGKGNHGYHDVWPILTEAELGTIMQAGADKFLYMEATDV